MKKKLLFFVGILCSMGSMLADTYEWSYDGQKTSLSVTAAKGTNTVGTYSGYSISYGGDTYTKAVKMESATTLTFTTTKSATITVGVALKNGSTYANADKTALKITTKNEGEDDVVATANTGITASKTGATTEDGLSIVFSSVGAGTQVIARASSEEGVFYIKVEEEDASKVNNPIITPVWGDSYGDATTVTITTTTADASIYYTTDGTVPTASSTAYTAPFTVTSATYLPAITTSKSENPLVVNETVLPSLLTVTFLYVSFNLAVKTFSSFLI